MRVYIANFGRENWAWSDCLRRSTLAVMDDTRTHPFWKNGDREGYILATQKIGLSEGNPITKSVASRWFNLNTLFMETAGDLWIHREKTELWWSMSSAAAPSEEIIKDPKPLFGEPKIHLYRKPCSGWSDRDQRGRPLNWNGLHPKAKDFLFTEGTCQQLSDDNSSYAQALIAGQSLSSWHNRTEWAAREERSRRYPVSYYDARKKTFYRMASTAFATAKASGTVSEITKKGKEVRFNDQIALEHHIEQLWTIQEGLCALTGLNMVLDGQDGDPQLLCSLDRIDSNGHYERGNLQVVCQFANRWKGDSDNSEFLRLIEKLVSAST